MQHAVEPSEVCQPDRMALVSLTGFLSSPSRLLAWSLIPALRFSPHCASAASREATNLNWAYPTPYARWPGVPSPGRQRPGWLPRLGRALDVGWPRGYTV